MPAAASIVVPTRNRSRYLGACLRSIRAQEVEASYEVIVVDDGSKDDTATVAERAGAKLIRQPERGPNAARNVGVRNAEADLVVFADDDVDAPRGWLAAYIEGADRHPDADAFGGPIRARFEGPTPRSCGREPPPITTLDLGSADQPVDFVWGANMAIRRRAFERVGPFDEDLPQYGEEEEWLARLHAAGGRVVYLADARVDHRREGDDARLGVLIRAAYTQGQRLRHHDVRRGTAPTLARELRVLAGCGWHTARYACPQGLVMGAHSLGRVLATVRSR